AAEQWCGAARGAVNAVFISFGNGIEAGLLIEGRTVRGASGRAGAIGWLALSETFREEYAEWGTLAVEAGRRSLVRRTIELWTGSGDSTVGLLSVSNPADLSPEVVLRAARAGDQLAVKVVSDLCTWLGRAVADVISTLNPEIVVIGGVLGRALRPFYGDLRREARKWAEPTAGRQCRIVGADLGDKSALIGAARLAFEAKPDK
ncbi:MAG: ROK family protein, partial [Acidobacteriota bacterium]